MKCKKCNAELKEDAVFCGSCGAKVEAEQSFDETVSLNDDAEKTTVLMSDTEPVKPVTEDKDDLDQYMPKESEPPVAGKGNKKKKSKKKLAVGVVLVIVLLLVAAFIIGSTLIGIGAYVLISNNFFGVFDKAVGDVQVEQPFEDMYGDITIVVTENDEPVEITTEEPAVTTPVEEETTTTTEAVITEPVEEPNDNKIGSDIEYTYAIDQRIVIADGGLRIRSEPVLEDANILGLIPNGAIVTIYEIEDNWAYASVGGKYGWCSCDYLFVPYEYAGTPMYSATVYCPTFEGAELYSENYSETDLLRTTVLNGSVVNVYMINGDMAFVKYSNLYGWCSTEYLVTD